MEYTAETAAADAGGTGAVGDTSRIGEIADAGGTGATADAGKTGTADAGETAAAAGETAAADAGGTAAVARNCPSESNNPIHVPADIHS